jgi:hypothetical protein
MDAEKSSLPGPTKNMRAANGAQRDDFGPKISGSHDGRDPVSGCGPVPAPMQSGIGPDGAR